MMRPKTSVNNHAAKKKPIHIVIDPLNPTTEQVHIIKEMCMAIQMTRQSRHIVCNFKASGKWLKQHYKAIVPPEEVFAPARQYIVEFTHSVEVYPHTIINPLKLDELTSTTLALLLEKYHNQHHLESYEPRSGQQVLYFMPSKSNKKSVISLHLASLKTPLVRYPRSKHPDEFQYAIYKQSPLAKGGLGAIYKSTHKIVKVTKANGDIVVECKPKKRSLAAKKLYLPEDRRGHLLLREESNTINRDEQNQSLANEGRMLRQMSFFRSSKVILSDNESSPTLLMPLLEGHELFYALALYNDNCSKPRFTVDQLIQITIMAGEAVMYVHKKNVIHRDVKAENMIIKLDEKLKPLTIHLVDFGLARFAHEDEADDSYGTPGYIAPELFLENRPTQQSDAYSFAYMLNELLWDDKVFIRDNLTHEHMMILINIINRGLEHNPQKRAALTDMVDVFKEIQSQRASNELTYRRLSIGK